MVNRKTPLFRVVNETMNGVLIQFDADEPAEFFCECPLRDCQRRVLLTRREYELVRATGGFLVSPECRHWANVLVQTPSYVAVRDFRARLERVPEPARHSSPPRRQPREPAPTPAARPGSWTTAARAAAAR